MPRAKAQTSLLGLIESESEADLGLESRAAKPQNVRPSKTMPPKKAAARGRGSTNKVTKPGQATNRPGAKSAAVADAKDASRSSGSGRGRSTKAATATEIADSQAPVDEPTQPAKAKPGRGRRKAATPEEDDRGIDPLSDPIVDLEAEPLKPMRGQRGRVKKMHSAVEPITEIPETQLPPDPLDISTHDETDRMEDLPPPSVSTRQAHSSFSVSRPAPPIREHGTAMAEASLRRRLGELTHKYDSLEQKYRDLREIGVKEAELNFDKLKKQSDERANSESPCRLVSCLIYALLTFCTMQLPIGWWPR